MKDDSTYKMWYGGIYPSHIGYATSPDGLAWEKLSNNPVLNPGEPGAWDDYGVSEPFVMKENNIYAMYYWGMNLAGVMQIGVAASPDGITWLKFSENPVLTVGAPGTWESVEVGTPWVIHQNGVPFKMWYVGQDSTGQYAIGYATSNNGLEWTKYDENPVLTGSAGAWDTRGVLSPSILFDGTRYQMWYFGKDAAGTNRIGYATSLDGIHWSKCANNPVLGLGSSGAWDSTSVAFPKVILDNGVYKMWYLGSKDTVNYFGYATASELNLNLYLPQIRK